MIVAIEGTSAAGKTTWCRTHAAGLWIAEDAPGPERWRRALALEAANGLAVCDTDPAKLYYGYALRRTGRLDAAAWAAQLDAARGAFAAGDLGLPDVVCFAERDLATLERHRASEPGRRRHRFALHAELQPWFKAWWEAVDAAAPGHVLWRHPDSLEELRGLPPRRHRTGDGRPRPGARGDRVGATRAPARAAPVAFGGPQLSSSDSSNVENP